MNFKEDDHVIAVGGENQPSVEGVEDFVTKFSNHLGKEVAGSYLSSTGSDTNAKITHMYIDEYKENEPQKASNTPTLLFSDPQYSGLNAITDYHTHLTNMAGVSRNDIEKPSEQDKNHKARQSAYYVNFVILTRSASNPSSVMKIPY